MPETSLHKYKSLGPTVWKLGWISLLGDIASEMLYPILPLFLTVTLGASMQSLGAIEGFAAFFYNILQIASGFWVDKIQRYRNFLFFGYLLSAISRPLIGIAYSWPTVLLARTLDKLGKGIRTTPRDTLLAASVDKSRRGLAFGFHRGMDTLGATIGPLFTLVFLSLGFSDLRGIFILSLIPGVACAALALTLVEPKAKPTPLHSNEEKTNAAFDKKFLLFLAGWCCFCLANSSDTFLIMKTHAAGLSLTQSVGLYCAYNLLYSLCSPLLGEASDKWGRLPVLTLGLLLFALVYAGFAYAESIPQFLVLFLLYGIFNASTQGIAKALAADLAPKGRTGTALGWFGGLTGISILLSCLWSGFVWDHFGPTPMFLLSSAISVVSIPLLWLGMGSIRSVKI